MCVHDIVVIVGDYADGVTIADVGLCVSIANVNKACNIILASFRIVDGCRSRRNASSQRTMVFLPHTLQDLVPGLISP